MSATNINDAIDKSKFEVHPIWITKEGHPADEKDFYKVLANPKYIIKNSNKIINISNMAQLANLPEIDIFFTIIHGKLYEDCCLHGLFRFLNKPFVGDDVLAAAVIMDK